MLPRSDNYATSTASGRTRTRQANAISAGTFASHSKHSVHVDHAHYLLLEYAEIIRGFWELSNPTSHSFERGANGSQRLRSITFDVHFVA